MIIIVNLSFILSKVHDCIHYEDFFKSNLRIESQQQNYMFAILIVIQL